jgi:hypothetical protein
VSPAAGDDKETNGSKYEKVMVPLAAQEACEMPPAVIDAGALLEETKEQMVTTVATQKAGEASLAGVDAGALPVGLRRA